jgi:ribosomal protein S18 acetylase RimI-like enzyme
VVRSRPLHEVPAGELRALLQEESAHWGEELQWDYSEVSSAVASGFERRALNGRVAHDGLRAVAYCYFMPDSGRAIVGSLYAREGFRGQGIEEDLLEPVLDEAKGLPSHARVECQTLFSTAPGAEERFARAGFLGRARHYLMRELRMAPDCPPHSFRLRALRRDDLPAAADLIFRSHEGTIDAALNLTYSSPGLCRGFVETLVLRAGCGRFDAEASLVAENGNGLIGVLLASHLSRLNGHICQVSVDPDRQARGLGTVLMTRALEAFRAQGLASASLSVTVANEPAYRLYRRLGFRLKKEFAAHAWVRPPARIELPS